MLNFVDVSKEYPQGYALKDITLEILPGEFVLITGPSGAGKTTFIKLLLREEVPTAGSILFENTEVSTLSHQQLPFWRRQVGVVFQNYRLLSSKTAFENIALALRVVGKTRKEVDSLVPPLLSLVGLEGREGAFPHELSGGEQQRLAIARAVSHNPRLLVADEPVGNLDEKTAWEIMNLLREVNSWGTTVLVASHNRSLVDSFGKRVLVLDKGVLVEDRQ